MKTFNFIFLAVFAKDYIFDHRNGVIFQEDEKISIHDASIPIDINLLLDSPREKFRRSLNADCGESYLKEKMPSNFFGVNGTLQNTTTDDCILAFRTFDEILMSFMGQDLVMTSAYNRSNFMQRSENLNRETKKVLAGPTFEEWMKNKEKSKSRRRRAAMAIGAGLVIAGTGGYTLYADAKSRARDALLADEIELERERISKLETVVETVNSKLDAAVKRIRKSKRPIVSWGGLTIPDDAKAVSRILEGADAEINQYFAAQSAMIGREIVESILTLKNHRLPLNTIFLDAVKAHCISYQSTVSEEEAKEFCNSFAFHTTRWDTRLRFQGYGLTTWERLDGKDQDKTNLEIRQVIISIRIEIPRMKLTARKYQIVNLGYFKEDGTRWKIDVPQHIVLMPSRETVEMRPADCLKFTPSYSCSSVSLAPNQCAESILLHNSTRYCQIREIDNRKCGYFEDQRRAYVSMAQPGIAQWFHHAPSERVMKIDSFKKTPFSGALNCGPQILRISAMIPEKEKSADSMIHFIRPLQIAMRTVQDDEMDEMNDLIKNNLDSVKQMGETVLKMNLTTMELVKRTAVAESKEAAENAKSYLFKTFIAPIIGSLSTIAIILFSAIIIYIAIKSKSRRRKRTERYDLENFSQPKQSNRRNSLL